MSRAASKQGFRVEVRGLGTQSLLLEDVRSLQVLLEDGSWLGIRPGHAPLIAATGDGSLKVRIAEKEMTYPVPAGILTLRDNVVSILTSFTISNPE